LAIIYALGCAYVAHTIDVFDAAAKSPERYFSFSRRNTESSLFNMRHNLWTPAYAGVTTCCETIIFNHRLKKCGELNPELSKENWKTRIINILTQDGSPGQISAGLAAGIFIGCTPFYGLQTFIALAIAFVFRLNKPACIAGLWIHNPITMVPIMVISCKLGCMLLGLPSGIFSYQALNWQYMKSHLEPFILGSMVTGLLASIPSYFICNFLIRAFRRKQTFS
jgi:uncharacterized protein (TIGR03546 family)